VRQPHAGIGYSKTENSGLPLHHRCYCGFAGLVQVLPFGMIVADYGKKTEKRR